MVNLKTNFLTFKKKKYIFNFLTQFWIFFIILLIVSHMVRVFVTLRPYATFFHATITRITASNSTIITWHKFKLNFFYLRFQS
jgi:hypothetical protein